MKRRILRLAPTAVILSSFLVVMMSSPVAALAELLQFPHSGDYQWYSGRGAKLNNTLTGTFYLPTGTPGMTFWAWYDIQPDWDYGYVEISTDNGKTWVTMPSNISTNTDPNGNNSEGNGITGSSAWTQVSVDLSGYAGQTVELRFRYETDKIVHHVGWAIDDIEVSGYPLDDVEEGSFLWTANGWTRLAAGIYDTEGAIDDVIEEVEDLVAGGTLDEGQGKSLADKLQNAKTKLEEGKTIPAINQLKSFISQVQALTQSGTLTQQEGSELIDAANDVISAIPG